MGKEDGITPVASEIGSAADLIHLWDEGAISTGDYVHNGLRLYAEALDGFEASQEMGGGKTR